ncbi:MAG: hypothetical protein GEU90_02430 [Gemmatimonas sp.]|nr:hypothetical protein [Gemmatimonas sp.]
METPLLKREGRTMTWIPTSFRTPLPIVACAVALATSLATPAVAQQAEEPEEDPTLIGLVVDAQSGAPIPAAEVVIIDRAEPVLSDRNGHFTFRDVRPGETTFIVTQLGYDSLRTTVDFDPSAEPVTLSLQPDPVVLERVTTIADRFATRRRASGASVRAFDRMGLLASSDFSALDFVLSRTGVTPTRCPNRLAHSPCAYVRGRPTEVQVYVDGARIIGGLDYLGSLRPEELYVLEVVGGGRVIRAYSNWYMETIARGRAIPTGYLF